jgi:hypothetical protein
MDDIDLACSMVIKTLKTIELEEPLYLLPLYKEDDDELEGEREREREEEQLNSIQNEETQGHFEEIDDDDDDEEDEDYLKKFDESLNKNIIRDHHPELQIHSYEEIEALCTIVRDERGNIIDPFHKTLPIVTRYEKARVLGERAKQIDAGGAIFVEVEESLIDAKNAENFYLPSQNYKIKLHQQSNLY